MEIRRIDLENFRQFKSANIDFSIDREKPFTIVLGSNTHGKTTMIRAFLWCLYGKNEFDDQKLINKDVADELRIGETATVKVTLEFCHNDTMYTLAAKETYIKNKNICMVNEKRQVTMIKRKRDGNSDPISNQDDIINEIEREILSSQLAPYFFFDGETNRIEKVTKGANLKNSVSDIMDLKKIETLRDYFDSSKLTSVYNVIYQKLTTRNDVAVESFDLELQEAVSRKEDYEEKVKNLSDQVEKLDVSIENLEQILINNSETKNNQEKKQRLEHDIEKSKNEIESCVASILPKLNAYDLLLNDILEYSFKKNDLRNRLSESDFLTAKSLSHISVEAIDQIIERGTCICGTQINDSCNEYKCLLEQKEYIAPKNYGKSIEIFLDQEINMSDNNKLMARQYEDLIKNTIKQIQDYDVKKEQLNNIKRILEGKPNMGNYQRDIENQKRQKNMLLGQIRELSEGTIPREDRTIQALRAQINSYNEQSKTNDFYKQCLMYVDSIYKLACNELQNKSRSIRENLESVVNEIFKQMYHGNRRIRISDSYKVESTLESDESLEASMGLQTVVNFSFVAGLIRLIRTDKLNEFDDIELEQDNNEVYPLVMDAPFSNTDESHIKNICLTLPNYCQQIFIAVMKKDFETAGIHIRDKIGKTYEIVKETETFSKIIEVSE